MIKKTLIVLFLLFVVLVSITVHLFQVTLEQSQEVRAISNKVAKIEYMQSQLDTLYKQVEEIQKKDKVCASKMRSIRKDLKRTQRATNQLIENDTIIADNVKTVGKRCKFLNWFCSENQDLKDIQEMKKLNSKK